MEPDLGEVAFSYHGFEMPDQVSRSNGGPVSG